MGIDVRRGSERFLTSSPGRVTRHSFSFGPHYDPENLGFGPLVCHDDHTLDPGAGFPDHRHSDVEIVTWVVRGALSHDGSSLLRPGQVAVQSAGSGVVHSERAAGVPTRFLQAWLRPDAPGGAPVRDVADVAVAAGRWTPLVGPDAPLAVGVAGAALAGVRLERGRRVRLPVAPLVHLHVTTGAVTADEEPLAEGDALRVSGGASVEVVGAEEALLLAWSFAAPMSFGVDAGRTHLAD